jgi:hypothetical protein
MTWCRAIPGMSARTRYQRSPRTSSFSRATCWPPDVEGTTTPVERCTERPADSVETLNPSSTCRSVLHTLAPLAGDPFVVGHWQESGGAIWFSSYFLTPTSAIGPASSKYRQAVRYARPSTTTGILYA